MFKRKHRTRYLRTLYCYKQYKELAQYYELKAEQLEQENETLRSLVAKSINNSIYED